MGCTEPGFAVGGASPRMDALTWILATGCDGDLQLLPVRLGALAAELRLGNINEEEAMVGCKSFKEALDDVADEQIWRRS